MKLLTYLRRALSSLRLFVGGPVLSSIFGNPTQKGARKSHAVREAWKTGVLIREALAVAYGMYRALVVSAWPGNLKLSELTDRVKRVGRAPAPFAIQTCFSYKRRGPLSPCFTGGNPWV